MFVDFSKLPVGSSITIQGDGESITWKKVKTKITELIRTHKQPDGSTYELSEPMSIHGYERAQIDLDIFTNDLGWIAQGA